MASSTAWRTASQPACVELGVERGDRVAVVLPNGVEAAIAIYGILRAGAAFSPLNPTIKRDKLGHVLADSGAAAVICDARRLEVVEAAVSPSRRDPDRHGRREAGRRQRYVRRLLQ